MTFFYDLNKKLASLANKQEPQQLSESAVAERATGDYSAKKARAGKDIGKPGKAFDKIAKGAAERYGSKAAGERVAGAVLAKLRSKTNEADMEEGNEFSGELAKARASGAKEFNVDGKTYQVKEAAKPDYIDLDKDGNKKEPMKKAAKEKSKGAIAEAVARVEKSLSEKFAAMNESEANEDMLSPKQKKIAGAAEPKDKITGADFKALKAKKKAK